MGLELRRNGNQQLRSNWWYGRYMINGKRRFMNLGIEVSREMMENGMMYAGRSVARGFGGVAFAAGAAWDIYDHQRTVLRHS